jgi:hypothetical protein
MLYYKSFYASNDIGNYGKSMKALDSNDKDDNIVSVTKFQELKDDVKRVHENLSEIKTMLASLINKSK